MLLKTPPSSLWVTWKHMSLAFHEITEDYIRGDTDQWSICLCRPPPNYFTAWLLFSSLRFLNSRILTYLNLTLYPLSLFLWGRRGIRSNCSAHLPWIYVSCAVSNLEVALFIVYVLWCAHASKWNESPAVTFFPPTFTLQLLTFSKNQHISLRTQCSSLTTLALIVCQENFFSSLRMGDDGGFSLWLAGADRFWSMPLLFHHIRQMGNRLEAAADRWQDGCNPPQLLRHATAWGTVLSLGSKIMSQ